MEWQPWYKFVIIALIIVIVKAMQQNTTKKFKINSEETDGKRINSLNDESDKTTEPSFEGSISNLILQLIEEMGYILISKNISNTLDYEITFVNYEKKFFDLKRQSTFIKVTGNDKSKEISYTTWSERYEYGQNIHNDGIAHEFLEKLKEKMS